jgi:single-strand DNA-binding protein
MLSALASGRLVRDPKRRVGKNNKSYTTALIAVPVETLGDGDADRVLVSVIAFGKAAEALGALAKGDDVSVAGSARLSSWTKDGVENHGLSVTSYRVLSAYQRRKAQAAQQEPKDNEPATAAADDFNDDIPF